ncbi:DMT family transporter [Methylobacterium gnaphalii]|uniref:DMT family transporter n=1 Tax=Methylobacterium gnaphalii TaxID=1010610 RepID=A0A512JJX4_9HYPH|nr:DMT family transporter [Methylobacterium gnaphalii]GEP10172.1 hypothetical protein MGN01_20170 [Methylobacterium gnaphalii]GJD69520.1 hypothetical protein MMMDOFMJ_2451 [Methylobacterium gnaphalii]GLS48688.1 hypothetical protein GCM10007885_15320 [Methylobacterium gnaphalii]
MWTLYALAIAAGISNAIQPGQNATLSKSLGMPITAGLITLIISATVLLVGGLAVGKLQIPSGPQLAQVPWWAWFGGLFSVLLILTQLYASPAIGAATFLGIIVTVGVATSLVLDHFGWVGFEVHHASVWRVLGAGLMVIGVALVALF